MMCVVMSINAHRWNEGRMYLLDQMELQGISNLYLQTFLKFAFFQLPPRRTMHISQSVAEVKGFIESRQKDSQCFIDKQIKTVLAVLQIFISSIGGGALIF